MIMDGSQISLLKYAGRFTALLALLTIGLPVLGLLSATFLGLELSIGYVSYMIAMFAGYWVGKTIYNRHDVYLEGFILLKLTGLCLVGALILEGVITTIIVFGDPSKGQILNDVNTLFFAVLFFAFFKFGTIWLGLKLGCKRAEKKAYKRVLKAIG
ncbi:hypothetical protein PsAD37_05472 [Pseudovibrio sp. Ad37]|nr:hypothetical protein PsAD37_05472 [Pseudovibrio sp. Ad37]